MRRRSFVFSLMAATCIVPCISMRGEQRWVRAEALCVHKPKSKPIGGESHARCDQKLLWEGS